MYYIRLTDTNGIVYYCRNCGHEDDTITIDNAGDIDRQWTISGMPENGLRIYGLRRSGNRTITFLGSPGLNGSAPTYVLSNGKYLHLTGPTLAEWQAQQRNVQIALDNAARYEAQAADSKANGCEVNARCFADKAAFYTAQAAQIASR
jgi:hypothetical protein